MSSFAPYLSRLVLDWSGQGGLGVREVEGTLVSVDLSGFTALSERLQAKGRAGAEELTLAVSGVFQGLIGITERHDGDVLKFRGDALLLFFDGEDHERRACYAAADMQWLIRTTGEMMSSVGPVTLRMSTGVYTGTCHFFLVEGTHRELVIAGPAATATIELESGAEAGEILLSERTAAALPPDWVGPSRGDGRLLLELPEREVAERPESPLPRAVGRDRAVRPRAAAGAPAARGRRGGAPSGHRRLPQVHGRRRGDRDATAPRRSTATCRRSRKLLGDELKQLGLTWFGSDIDEGGGKIYIVGGAPSSTGADEERMLRALRTRSRDLRGVDAARRSQPRPGVLRGHRDRGLPLLQRHGRHDQSRGAPHLARRARRPADHRRCSGTRPDALRDDLAVVPPERKGTPDHGLPRRRRARREGGGAAGGAPVRRPRGRAGRARPRSQRRARAPAAGRGADRRAGHRQVPPARGAEEAGARLHAAQRPLRPVLVGVGVLGVPRSAAAARRLDAGDGRAPGRRGPDALDRRGDARPGAAGAADRRSLRCRGSPDARGRRSSTLSSGATGCTSASGRCSRASC